MAPRLSYRKGVRSTACTVAPRTGGTLARTFFASMTDKVRSAHTPMRTLSILLPSVIMAAIRLFGPTSLCPPCFLAYADRAVQPTRRNVMTPCPHRRPLPVAGSAGARASTCVRPTRPHSVPPPTPPSGRRDRWSSALDWRSATTVLTTPWTVCSGTTSLIKTLPNQSTTPNWRCSPSSI